MPLIAVAQAPQAEVLLRRTFKTGETAKYRIVTHSSQTVDIPNGLGKQDFTIDATVLYAMKVDAANADGADVELTTTLEKTEAGGSLAGMMPPVQQVPPIVRKGRYDARNRFTAAGNTAPTMALDRLVSAASQAFNGTTVEFPEKAIHFGDTWDVTVPKGPTTGSEDQKLTAKLVGDRVVGGKPVWVVSVEGSFKMHMEPAVGGSSNALADNHVVSDGTIAVDSEVLLAKDTDETVSSTSTIVTNAKTTVASMTIDAAGTAKTTVTRVEE